MSAAYTGVIIGPFFLEKPTKEPFLGGSGSLSNTVLHLKMFTFMLTFYNNNSENVMFTCAAISETPLIQKNALLDPNFGWEAGSTLDKLTYRTNNHMSSHVFGLWKGTWALGENPGRYGESMQSPHRKASGSQAELYLPLAALVCYLTVWFYMNANPEMTLEINWHNIKKN